MSLPRHLVAQRRRQPACRSLSRTRGVYSDKELSENDVAFNLPPPPNRRECFSAGRQVVTVHGVTVEQAMPGPKMIEAAPSPTAASGGEDGPGAGVDSLDLTSLTVGGNAGGGGAAGERLIACGLECLIDPNQRAQTSHLRMPAYDSSSSFFPVFFWRYSCFVYNAPCGLMRALVVLVRVAAVVLRSTKTELPRLSGVFQSRSPRDL